MCDQYADDSECEGASDSGSDNNSDETDEERAGNNKTDKEGSDPTLCSDDGHHCGLSSPRPTPTGQTKKLVLPSKPILKIVSTRTTLAADNVPVSNIRNSGNTNAGASTKPTAIVPKKRPYVDTVAENNSAKITSTSDKSLASTSKDPAEEVNRVLPEESRNKPKGPVEKPRKSVTWAIDEPAGNKGRPHVIKRPLKDKPRSKKSLGKKRRDVKKRPKKALPSQCTDEGHSTSIAVEDNVECVAMLPLADEPRLGTSKKEINKRCFWADTLASDFDSLDYEALLKKSRFSEEQAEALKQSFHLLSRKLYIATTYTDRRLRTYLCVDCKYTISHECVSPVFTQYARSNANVISMNSVTPESVNMCMCGFAFFHSHTNRPRPRVTDNLSSINISRLVEHDRSIHMSCPKCHMNIVMKNQNIDICCDFINWTNLKGAFNRVFYIFIKERLHVSEKSEPSLNELYACNRRCCLLFHRCAEDAAPLDNSDVTRLTPITTYTRVQVSRSNI